MIFSFSNIADSDECESELLFSFAARGDEDEMRDVAVAVVAIDIAVAE